MIPKILCQMLEGESPHNIDLMIQEGSFLKATERIGGMNVSVEGLATKRENQRMGKKNKNVASFLQTDKGTNLKIFCTPFF